MVDSRKVDGSDGIWIDAGVHVWPRDLVHPVQRQAVPLAAEPADLLRTLDENLVSAAVVSAASLYPVNEYVTDFSAKHPSRIWSVAGVDLRDPAGDSAVGQAADSGARGLRITSRGGPLQGDHERAALDVLVDAAVRDGLVMQWTLELPVATSGIVERAAARAEGGRHVVDHLGLPDDIHDLDMVSRIRALASVPNVTVKLSGMYAMSTSGFPYEDTWPWIESVLDAFGPDRTMWASDWPLSSESAPYARQIELIAQLPFLDADSRRQIGQGTAARVWSPSRDR